MLRMDVEYVGCEVAESFEVDRNVVDESPRFAAVSELSPYDCARLEIEIFLFEECLQPVGADVEFSFNNAA